MNKKELKKLKTASRKWSPAQWETYLESLEHKGSESYIHYSRLENRPYKPLWETSQSKYTHYIPLLKNAMKRLTPKQRKVIRLTYWEGLSERDIAVKLSLSRSGAKKRKTLALQRLRKEFKAKEVTSSPYSREMLSMKTKIKLKTKPKSNKKPYTTFQNPYPQKTHACLKPFTKNHVA